MKILRTSISKLVLLLIFFNSFQHTLYAQETEKQEKITEEFFKVFKTDPVKAYDNLFAKAKWVQKSDIETIKIKLKDFLSDLGEYHGYEQVTTKRAGESYLLKSFLIKYDRQPVRFTFILYKPSDTWKIQNFSYDTGLNEELEQAAKIDRLRENW
jgi:hypothetical protein